MGNNSRIPTVSKNRRTLQDLVADRHADSSRSGAGGISAPFSAGNVTDICFCALQKPREIQTFPAISSGRTMREWHRGSVFTKFEQFRRAVHRNRAICRLEAVIAWQPSPPGKARGADERYQRERSGALSDNNRGQIVHRDEDRRPAARLLAPPGKIFCLTKLAG
jgi:hypothetical protein